MEDKNLNEFTARIYDKNLRAVDIIKLPSTQSIINEILDLYELDSSCKCDVCDSTESYLKKIVPKDVNIFTLNLLAEKLSKMDYEEKECFKGMILEEKLRTKTSFILLNQMLNIADSVDKCQYISNVKDDKELGKFYCEKDFSNLPNDIIDYMSFEKLGEKIRNENPGIYLNNNFIIFPKDIEQKYKEGFVPELEQMEGTVLLNVEYEKKSVKLWLPACQDDVKDVLDEIGGKELYDCNIELKDCIAPSMMYLIERELKENANIDLINKFAFNLEQFQKQGELNKYKAIVEAEECTDIKTANSIAGQMNNYYYSKTYIDPIVYASLVLEERIPEIELNIDYYESLSEFLYDMGEALMKEYGINNTIFGTVVCGQSEAIKYVKQIEEDNQLAENIACKDNTEGMKLY